MRKTIANVVGATGLLIASAATAQSGVSPPASDARSTRAVHASDIIVTARKPVDTKTARTFARQASAPIDRQLARFRDPACPMAIGFSPTLAAQIVTRMRAVAALAHAPLDKPGCKGNMILIAADDGADMMRTMDRLGSPLIGGIVPADLKALIALKGPVRSWTWTTIQNEDGDEPFKQIGGGSSGEDGANLPFLTIFSGSRVNPGSQPVIGLSVVLIDWPAMMGKSPTQIADYAAMRTLAKTRDMPGGGAVDTILGLFTTDHAVPGLTAADAAYLTGLYRLPGTRYDHIQFDEIAYQMKKASSLPAEPAAAAPK